MILIKQNNILRADLRDNPEVTYLFGDNLQKFGLKGQSKEMRGEPNGFGIPTKKKPCLEEDCFFTDGEYLENYKAIRDAIWKASLWARTQGNGVVVIPADGLGTGLAKLKEKAPRTYEYLQRALYNEFSKIKQENRNA